MQSHVLRGVAVVLLSACLSPVCLASQSSAVPCVRNPSGTDKGCSRPSMERRQSVRLGLRGGSPSDTDTAVDGRSTSQGINGAAPAAPVRTSQGINGAAPAAPSTHATPTPAAPAPEKSKPPMAPVAAAKPERSASGVVATSVGLGKASPTVQLKNIDDSLLKETDAFLKLNKAELLGGNLTRYVSAFGNTPRVHWCKCVCVSTCVQSRTQCMHTWKGAFMRTRAADMCVCVCAHTHTHTHTHGLRVTENVRKNRLFAARCQSAMFKASDDFTRKEVQVRACWCAC